MLCYLIAVVCAVCAQTLWNGPRLRHQVHSGPTVPDLFLSPPAMFLTPQRRTPPANPSSSCSSPEAFECRVCLASLWAVPVWCRWWILPGECRAQDLEMANPDPFTDSGSSESVIEEIRIIRVIWVIWVSITKTVEFLSVKPKSCCISRAY